MSNRTELPCGLCLNCHDSDNDIPHLSDEIVMRMDCDACGFEKMKPLCADCYKVADKCGECWADE